MNSSEKNLETGIDAEAVHALLVDLPAISEDNYNGGKDQILVFQWLVKLSNIIGERMLPQELHEEVVSALKQQ